MSRRRWRSRFAGLRKMRGRMRKQAEEALVEGLGSPDRATAETCRNALIVLKRGKTAPRRPSKSKARSGNFEIKEVPGKERRRRQPQKGRRPDDHMSSRRH